MIAKRLPLLSDQQLVSKRGRKHDHFFQIRVIGGIGSLIIACLVSPCCAPLLVPVLLALFAGTPLAVVLAQSIGWIYAGLTVISGASLYLGWRWLTQNRTSRFVSAFAEAHSSACPANCSCRENI